MPGPPCQGLLKRIPGSSELKLYSLPKLLKKIYFIVGIFNWKLLGGLSFLTILVERILNFMPAENYLKR